MSREWAYVALSRGRQSNRLYVAAQPDDARAEFAPVEPSARDPVERLATSLRASDGQVLAIDTRRPEPRASAMDAERDADARRVSGARSRATRPDWLPGGAGELDGGARARGRRCGEAAAKRDGVEAELRHGARPFVDA